MFSIILIFFESEEMLLFSLNSYWNNFFCNVKYQWNNEVILLEENVYVKENTSKNIKHKNPHPHKNKH